MKERLRTLLEKYKFVLVILLVGVVLMLLPTGEQKKAAPDVSQERFSLERVEADLEDILGDMKGVGRVKVMLTLRSGSTLQLAVDEDLDQRNDQTSQGREVVKLSRGSGQQEVVVTEETYPAFMGAVIVCDGGDSSEVRLRVTEAVAVLTSLSSDRISVVKWEENT